MSKRTIRILILVATASAALLVLAAPGIARRGHDDDRDRIRGTIASFTDGVLTIRQSNGDEVEGKVDRRTEIECEPRRSSTAGPRSSASPVAAQPLLPRTMATTTMAAAGATTPKTTATTTTAPATTIGVAAARGS